MVYADSSCRSKAEGVGPRSSRLPTTVATGVNLVLTIWVSMRRSRCIGLSSVGMESNLKGAFRLKLIPSFIAGCYGVSRHSILKSVSSSIVDILGSVVRVLPCNLTCESFAVVLRVSLLARIAGFLAFFLRVFFSSEARDIALS